MPTSPETTLNTATDSAGVEHAVSVIAPAPTIRSEWKRFGAFLKNPTLEAKGRTGSPLTVIARIYLLDISLMFVLIMAATIAVAAGVYIPETALAGVEFTLPIILGVIIAAPVMEEILFRGWLSGKPGHILALLLLGVGAAGFGLTHVANPVVSALVLIAAIIAALAAFFLLRKRGPMAWFARLFPAFFWFATLAFALVHLANFDEGSIAILLPLVLPQFILGTMLGYLRVRIGLWAAILLHAAHNATALGLALLGMLAGQ